MIDTYEYIGMPADTIDTPALLVDLDALEFNLDTLAQHFKKAGVNLRPHSKSHKTPAIAHKQLEAGAIGITCAKLGEAEVLAAVSSRPASERIITDAGLKSLTPEHGMPAVKDRDDLEVHALSEEHGRLRPLSGSSDLEVGAVLEFIPGHGCTTINLHDRLYAVRQGRLEAIWEIAGRGKVR